jgi:hypothetical protein
MYSKKVYKSLIPIDSINSEVPETTVSGTRYIGNPPPAKYFRKTSVCETGEEGETTCSSHPKVVEVIKNVDCCKTDREKIVRSANSNLDLSYYTTASQLLRERCRTYDQYISGFDKTVGSSQVRPDCVNCPGGQSKVGYYKRSNPKFDSQGAVSSSARLVRLKYNTVTTSSKYNPAQPRYRGDSTQNYYVQDQTPVCSHRVGNRTICR